MTQLTKNDAVRLDQEIEELLRDFIPLGQKLMEMRDSRLYLDLKNPDTGELFTTFEEYCRKKRHIAARYAQNIVRGSLVAQALTTGPAIARPVIERENQARVLADCVADFEEAEIPAPQGGVIRYPIAVSNPDALRKVWVGVAEKFKEAYDKASPEKKPNLTANFIANSLPARYRSKLGRKELKGIPLGKVREAVMAAAKLKDEIRDRGLDNFEELKEIAADPKHPWTQTTLQQVRRILKEAEDALGRTRDALSRLRL
jgi:hypothetical protein